MPARFTSVQKCALDRLATGIERFKTSSPRHHRFLTTFYASVGDQFTSLFGQMYITGVEEYNPIFFSKLHNDTRIVPYGVDTKWRTVLSTNHMFVAKLASDRPFTSEHRNSQKWLPANDTIADYFRRLQIFNHVRE